jgi:hypothetical protein
MGYSLCCTASDSLENLLLFSVAKEKWVASGLIHVSLHLLYISQKTSSTSKL